MEDIKKLVADLVGKQSAVTEENKTITKGLIEVSKILNDYAKEMEELEHFCQQITSIASDSQKAQSMSTSTPITKKDKEKEKPSNQQDSTEEELQSIWKEMSAFKKLVDGRTSKKCTEALNPSTVKPIPEDTNMGYTVPMDFDSNIVWLGSFWKELFEAFKAEFLDGKTPIPLLRCMENTALLAEQQSYTVELD
ncbi:hypothetical protein DSO57_1002358 [Entomophthora muscae]|uniref:Uncharacterized protein n=1 Tax=Entomophthora muscae TaxID=34485 RepID=A0ACC2UUV6_9FUNG|nr:hypothetical protein DSO57_1002358 [Entomophthora muscae]